MAPRPGPLMPYPIELFFKPDPNVVGTPGKHLLPSKRSLSPGSGSVDSPAKRRLMAQEGAAVLRGARSPLSGSSSSARFAPSHFQSLLQGRDSPAKQLDFGCSKQDGSPSGVSDSTACDTSRSGSRTPRRSPKRTSNDRLRRSPRLSARASSVVPEVRSADQPAITVEVAPSPIRTNIAAPIIVPRTVTPPDRQSIHYPGFDIYQDPHIILPPSSSVSKILAAEASNTTPDEPWPDTKEDDKENLPPRRKSSKSKKAGASSTPSGTYVLKAAYLPLPSRSDRSDSSDEVNPVPASPHPTHVRDYLSTVHGMSEDRVLSPTASPAATLVGITPRRIPLGQEARKQMRKALEDEADDLHDDNL
ncbi:hypothetical protein BV20DRAFT_959851 [Pilatotrama ljubarskyi]|nr:hypothetical protein BV20DRAFT_959851 [Pilatotrama ljubarskyi]